MASVVDLTDLFLSCPVMPCTLRPVKPHQLTLTGLQASKLTGLVVLTPSTKVLGMILFASSICSFQLLAVVRLAFGKMLGCSTFSLLIGAPCDHIPTIILVQSSPTPACTHIWIRCCRALSLMSLTLVEGNRSYKRERRSRPFWLGGSHLKKLSHNLWNLKEFKKIINLQ